MHIKNPIDLNLFQYNVRWAQKLVMPRAQRTKYGHHIFSKLLKICYLEVCEDRVVEIHDWLKS